MDTYYYHFYEINLTGNPDTTRGGVEWSLCDVQSGDELDAGLAFTVPDALREAEQAADQATANSTPINQ